MSTTSLRLSHTLDSLKLSSFFNSSQFSPLPDHHSNPMASSPSETSSVPAQSTVRMSIEEIIRIIAAIPLPPYAEAKQVPPPLPQHSKRAKASGLSSTSKTTRKAKKCKVETEETDGLLLLFKAAQMVFGELKDDNEPPVVRSKRGRMQVLPNKYKDSLMEPLSSKNRSSGGSSLKRKR